jgi:hypothetical protein
MKATKEYEQSQQMIEFIRENSVRKRGRKMLNEEAGDDNGDDIIAITNEPRFGQNVLTNQIENFRKTVSGGAKFADENSEDAESNPLVFYPKSGNLVFSGSIPNLSGLKFQFSLNDVTNAPYIFVDGLALTDDVLNTLQRISGFYKNWRDEWEASTDLLDKLKKDYSRKNS